MNPVTCRTLVDTGASASFIDSRFTSNLGLNKFARKLPKFLRFTTPDTTLSVQFKLGIQFHLQGTPQEFIHYFYIASLGNLPTCILGHDFLSKYSAKLELGQDHPASGQLIFATTSRSPSTTPGQQQQQHQLSAIAQELVCPWRPLRSCSGSGYQFRVRPLSLRVLERMR